MKRFKITFAMLGLLTAGFAPSMRADDRDKETRLTTNQPLQVREYPLGSRPICVQVDRSGRR